MNLLSKFPMAVRSVETGISCGTSDIIAQTVVEKKGFNGLDLLTTLKFAAIGCLWTGPMMKVWYIR